MFFFFLKFFLKKNTHPLRTLPTSAFCLQLHGGGAWTQPSVSLANPLTQYHVPPQKLLYLYLHFVKTNKPKQDSKQTKSLDLSAEFPA